MTDLCIADARKHVHELRETARTNFPGTPLHEFVIWINQTSMPPTYHLVDLHSDEAVERPPWYPADEEILRSSIGTARESGRAVDTVRSKPEDYTIVKMLVTVGDHETHVGVLLPKGFWDPGTVLASFFIGEWLVTPSGMSMILNVIV